MPRGVVTNQLHIDLTMVTRGTIRKCPSLECCKSTAVVSGAWQAINAVIGLIPVQHSPDGAWCDGDYIEFLRFNIMEPE